MSTGLYSPWFYQQIRDNNNNPLSNGTMSTFENKSTIPKPVYSDIDLINPLENPVPLDSAGVVPRYFLLSGAYTFKFVDRFGNVLATADDVIGLGGDSGSTSAYVLPIASSTVLGGIKIGSGLSIDGSGVVSTVSGVSAQTISLSAYATLSGANFTGPITSPTLSSNSISANSFSTSSITITERNGLLNVEGSEGYYKNAGISFGDDSRNNIRSVNGQLYIGDNDSYASFNGSNFYFTSSNVVIGDPYTNPAVLGQKTLLVNQQLVQNYRATFNSSAFILDKFRNKQLTTDSMGQISGIAIGTIRYDANDKEGYLKDKIKSGAGVIITTASDSTGTIMSINARSNNWTLTKNITASSYIATDSDSTLVNNNYNSTIVLPVPSSIYDGRIVVVQGANLGGTATVSSLGTLVGEIPVITNYSKKEFICVFDNANWIWICRN